MDLRHQCTYANAKKRLYIRCENSSQNLWCSKNIYYLECRNRLKNPRFQNKSIKRNWQCYNDFQVSKTSIALMWDINAQMQRQRKDCILDVRIHPRICDGKNIYYLECRNRLKNPRYQNKSIKRNWQCYNDFQVSKTSIGWIWDINAHMQREKKDCTLDVRIHPRICDAQKHLLLRVP